MSHLGLLESELQNFQIELPSAQKILLANYCDELIHWNKTINLTALSGSALVRRLVVEPIWIARELSMGGSLVDIGSGNGSPAIPFQAWGAFQECHLVEVRAKRAAFLRHLVMTLRLPHTEIHQARFEDIAERLKPPDWISLQAVALSEKLVDSMRSIVAKTTTIVWITAAGTQTVLDPIGTLTVPMTGTQVSLFQLDLT